MPTRPDEPLRKVTLNLYASDCDWMIRNYGRDWTVRVRQHIHAEVEQRKRASVTDLPIRSVAITRRTLGDLG